jgi:ribosomal protein S6--L-glutamate ligase
MRIGIIVRWVNPNLEEMVQELSNRGAKVDLIYPDVQTISLANWRVDHDLYLLKSGTESALSMAGALHVLGAAILNPYPTTVLLRNKIIVTRALQAAGIPTPETYIAPDPEGLAPFLEDGPVIVKPYRGSRGEGVQIVTHPDELKGVPVDGPVLAQRYHKPDPGEADRKIYRIGEQIFGVKRIWPLRTYQDKYGEPFVVSSELSEIAMKCGEAFGLGLYGLDVVLSEGQHYVVDVNKFGSFIGVPDAPAKLADYVLEVGEGMVKGNTPLTVKEFGPAYR